MANELRSPWLLKTVGEKLASSYASVEDLYVPGNIVKEGQVEISRSFLAIKLTEQKRLVQIVKYENYHATISDGNHFIEAVFSEAATKSFNTKDARTVSSLRGGLMVILDFTLKFDPLSGSLLLEIASFQFRGSEGSRKFGHPVDISQNSRISEVLVKLRALMFGTTSTPEADSDSESSSIQSQEEIATQPYARNQRDPRAKDRSNSKSTNNGAKGHDVQPVVTSSPGVPKTADEASPSSTIKPVARVKDAQMIPDLRIDDFQGVDPFHGMKRVPRRHVARKAHKDILEAGCWFKPETHDRSRYAKMPAEIRMELDKFLDRKAGILDTTGISSEESDIDASISEDDEEDVNNDDVDVGNANRRSMNEDESSKVSQTVDSDMVVGRPDDTSPQSSPPTKTSQPLVGDLEDLVAHDSDEISWAPSSVNDNDAAVESSAEGNQTNLPSSPSAFIEQSSLASQVLQLHIVQPDTFHGGSNLRIPLVFPSSPVEVEELEISAPYAVGDMVEIDDSVSRGLQVLSQVDSSTAPQSSTSVQVKRTPRTATPLTGNTQVVKARQLTNTEGLFDEIIPATCEGALSGNTKEAMVPRRLLQTEITILSEMASPLNHRPADFISMSQGEEVRGNALSIDGDDSSRRQTFHGVKSPIFTKRTIPSTSLVYSSPPLQSVHSEATEKVQVPSTQMSPVPVRSRREVLGNDRGFESSKEKKARLKIAAKLLERDNSPIRDTAEMARGHRRSWMRDNRLGQDAQFFTSNSSPQATTILESSPVRKATGLENPESTNKFVFDKPSQATVDITQLSDETFQTQTDDPLRTTSTTQKNPIFDLSLSPQLQATSEQEYEVDSNPSRDGQSVTAFARFKDVYPDFTGSERKFTQALVYIEWLQSTLKLHQYLFDDIIRVYATVYLPWVIEQEAANLKPKLTCLEFYHERIQKPLFPYLVISLSSLQNDIASLNQNEVELVRKRFNQQTDTRTHDGLRSDGSLKHAGNKEMEAGEIAAIEEEATLEMRQSDIEIRPELLDASQERASSRSPQSSTDSSIIYIAPAELDNESSIIPQARVAPPQLQRTAPPYFQTVNQTLQTRDQRQLSNTRRHASPLRDRATIPEHKSHKRRDIPWLNESASSFVSALPTLPRALPKARNIPGFRRPNRSFDRPSPLQNISDPFLSDDIGRRNSKKRTRERSPILGSTPEPEPEPEIDSAPKHRRISKSISSSIHRHTFLRAPPSSSSDVSLRNMATVPQADQATKLTGWMNDPLLKEERARKVEAVLKEARKQFAKSGEVNNRNSENHPVQKPKTKHMIPVPKPDVIQKSAREPLENNKAPIPKWVKDPALNNKASMTADEIRKAAFQRKMDRRGIGMKSKLATSKFTPAKEGGSGSKSGSGSLRIGNPSRIEKGKARQL